MLYILFFFVLAAAAYKYHRYALRFRTYPTTIPWIGLRDQLFPIFRANFRDWFHAQDILDQGYLQYNKQNQSFISPTYHGHPEVILPKSYLPWLNGQSDADLSISTVLQEDLHFKYTSPGSFNFSRAYHIEALNKMKLDVLIPGMAEEIQQSIDASWGMDTKNWLAIDLYQTIGEVIASTMNRAVVGNPLCHNKEYHYWVKKFIDALGRQSMMIAILVPVVLRPIIAPLLAIPCRRADRECAKYVVPLIKQKLEKIEQNDREVDSRGDFDSTLLDWTVRLAAKSQDSRGHDPVSISSRLLSLTFVGVHTSLIAMINALLDLASSSPEVIDTLRREIEEVLADNGGAWSKSATTKLVYMDSFLRESLRLNVFKGRGVERQVLKSEGLFLPDGTCLPYGTRVGVSTIGIQHDEQYHKHPLSSRPFRFVDKDLNRSMINTSEEFLAFGYGRHACPGRFFSAVELKLLIAYILQNYETQTVERRPENVRGADFSVPPPGSKLNIRRRELDR